MIDKNLLQNLDIKKDIIQSNNVSELSNDNKEFSRTIKRPKYDEDLMDAMRKIQSLNMLMPRKINTPPSILYRDIIGEKVYEKNGQTYYIVQNKKKAILEYYPDSNYKYIKKIQEINAKTGKILSKMEFQISNEQNYTATITVFDGKINNSYTVFKILNSGIVKSITEFSSKNSFRALVRSTISYLPQKYVEAKEDENKEFYMEEITFYENGQLQEINKTSTKQQTKISYEGRVKSIKVKNLS